MFRTYKRGDYDLEACHANAKRTTALLESIAIAYTISLDLGRRIHTKQVHVYVDRPKETHQYPLPNSFLNLLLRQRQGFSPYL